MTITTRLVCLFVVVTTGLHAAPLGRFTETEAASVKAFLHDTFEKRNDCMVVGWVDESGSQVFSAGKLDNGTTNTVNGDTLFFIGSVSKTFTALLLQEMAERREVQLEDSLAKYLPKSVKVPAHAGKEITLLDLATHAAGLPMNPDNFVGANTREEYETFTVKKMYEFISRYSLKRDPGTEFEYSNVGMSLLGQALALRTGTNFESLVVNRICKPLGMESTCLTLTPELKARSAMGHEKSEERSLPFQLKALAPAGAVHSTANDLLKYAAAQAGLGSSELRPLMEKTQVIRYEDSHGLPGISDSKFFGHTAMDWVDRMAYQPPGMQLLGHAGGAGSYHAWVGFDKKQRRGVVVLSTANDISVEDIGWTLLQRLPLSKESTLVREMVGLGIGLELNAAREVRISKVFIKSSAAEAGVVAGQLIQKIRDVPVQGKSLADCLSLLRMEEGQKVRVELASLEGKETKVVELTKKKFLTTTQPLEQN